MYKDYFGLKDKPFSIAPDPQYLYMSERHREALAHLIYGLQTDGGFVLLTGEVGTGKTTVCRCLLEQAPENTEIAFVLNPKLTAPELLATICDELGIDYPDGNSSIKVFVDGINRFLLDTHAKGRKTVLIIDEAQNLSIDVLEQIRLLTNLETNKQKLLQVIMLGQPELKAMLEQPELRQLAQRITARYHLEPLSPQEMVGYISHRLAVAGVERLLFPAATIRKLYRLSGGVPRLINLLCDRALLGAYVKEHNTVSRKLMTATARELFGDNSIASQQATPQRSAARWLLATVAVVSVALLAYSQWPGNAPQVTAEPMTPAQVVEQQIVAPALASPASEAEAPFAVLSWPQDLPLANSQALAYQALFRLWGYDYQPQNSLPGAYALDQGMRYLNKRGSLGSLRQLNRPAVLTLTDRRGQTFYTTLTGLNADVATFVIGDEIRIVATSDLMEQWLGEFSLLWQPPSVYNGAVQPGDNGPMVLWLEQQLARLQQRTPSADPLLRLDGLLLDDVQQFQASEGLEADGIVGPITLIQLNSRRTGNHPQLTVGQEG
ncbi:MAG: AAA family ATPase [Desulfuromonas sp.]|nr:AAA family ATPase [Desulfuromonas sp.]